MIQVTPPRHHRYVLVCIVAVTLGLYAKPSLGQSPLLLVPEDASIAFAFAPVTTVDKKLNKIVNDANEQYLGLAPLGYNMLTSFFSLPNVADRTQPFALLIPNAKKVGVEPDAVFNTGLDTHLGGVFCHKGLEQLAKSTGTTVDEKVDGKAKYNGWSLEAEIGHSGG